MWGYEFIQILREIPDLKNELPSHLTLKYSPINTPDALYGLRTVGTKPYYRVKREEEIDYVEFISL